MNLSEGVALVCSWKLLPICPNSLQLARSHVGRNVAGFRADLPGRCGRFRWPIHQPGGGAFVPGSSRLWLALFSRTFGDRHPLQRMWVRNTGETRLPSVPWSIVSFVN